MFRLTSMIHAASMTAYTAVALSTFAPITARATSAPPSSLPAGAVAVVNGVVLPQGELDDAVRAATAKTGQHDTPQLRQVLRGELVAREVFRQNAEKAHYDQKPEVQAAVAVAKANAEIQQYVTDNVHPEVVTDDQVKARYDAIVASLGKDEFKPRLITVPDEATAKQLFVRLKSGQPFEVVAKESSIAPSRG